MLHDLSLNHLCPSFFLSEIIYAHLNFMVIFFLTEIFPNIISFIKIE